MANPYRPGFNQAPVVLAGRDDVLLQAAEALDVAVLDGFTPRPLVLVGPRGVGKTVLLAEVADRAGRLHGWPHVHTEVRADGSLLGPLTNRLGAIGAVVDDTPPTRRFCVERARLRAGVGLVGAEVELASGNRKPSGPVDLERALRSVIASLTSRASGLVLTVDEVQFGSRHDLGALTACLQEGVAEHWPLVVVLAGLPGTRGARQVISYLERADWQELSVLSRADSVHALRGPADAASRPMSEPAAHLLAVLAAAWGRTLGKQLTGIEVVREGNGGGPGLKLSLLRTLMLAILLASLFPLYPLLCLMMTALRPITGGHMIGWRGRGWFPSSYAGDTRGRDRTMKTATG